MADEDNNNDSVSSGEGSVIGYHAGPIGQPITFDIRIQVS